MKEFKDEMILPTVEEEVLTRVEYRTPQRNLEMCRVRVVIEDEQEVQADLMCGNIALNKTRFKNQDDLEKDMERHLIDYTCRAMVVIVKRIMDNWLVERNQGKEGDL